MKRKKLAFFYLLFVVCMITCFPTISKLHDESELEICHVMEYLENSPSYNKSDYIDFNGTAQSFDGGYLYFQIWIDDTLENHTWSDIAKENWCTGTGTVADPYVIENLYINAGGVGGGIHVDNSEVHFIIQNNWITNSEVDEHAAAVYLLYAKNGIIRDNIFIDVSHGVFFQFDCYDIIVSNNIMITDDRPGTVGVLMGNDVYDSIIEDNKILNFAYGVRCWNDFNITIDGNFVEHRIPPIHGTRTPMYLKSSYYLKVVNNILAGEFATGVIRITESLTSTNNVIEDNYISTNQSLAFNFTVLLSSSIHSSQDTSITINLDDGSSNNYVAHNIMLMDEEPSNEDDDTDTGSGGSIIGYDTFLILTLISLVSTIVLRKRLKQ